MSLLLSHDVELESVGGEPLFLIRSCEVRFALMAAICVEDYLIEGPETCWVEVDCLACRMFICRETACHFRRCVTFINVIQKRREIGSGM